MVVEIKDELFLDISEYEHLKFLINLCFYGRRHNLYADCSKIINSENFIRLDSIDQELLIVSFNESLQIDKIDQKVVVSKTSDEINFSIDEAIKYLNQPILILLENSLNDSYLIDAIFKNFEEAQELLIHFKMGWLLYDNLGGSGNIKNVIEQKLNAYKSWPKTDKSTYLRCLVILDSDKTTPSKSISQSKLLDQAFLNDKGILNHILEKREMENYLPEEILAEIDDEFIIAYINLTSKQKDYFSIQNGFGKNRSDKNHDPDVLEFYKNLTNEDWIILKNGLKSHPYDKKFKTEFPKLFLHRLINKKNLLARLNPTNEPHEFNQIINKTLSLI